jgi:hypothetical protein
MKAYAVVAHPDDCLIFAKCFIDNFDFDWTIVYLTYNATDNRAVEVSKYWLSRNVKVNFLGFVDMYYDLETDKLNYWNEELAINQLHMYSAAAELILTHNSQGEYGHIHHKIVHKAMMQLDKPKILFGSDNDYSHRLSSVKDLDLAFFPLHFDVLKNCNLSEATYTITTEAMSKINENINIR